MVTSFLRVLFEKMWKNQPFFWVATAGLGKYRADDYGWTNYRVKQVPINQMVKPVNKSLLGPTKVAV